MFGRGELADHFASQFWYRPRGDLSNQGDANAAALTAMTEAEINNAAQIRAHEDSIGCG